MTGQESAKNESSELESLRRRVAELEHAEVERQQWLEEAQEANEQLLLAGVRERDLADQADRERAKLRALVDAIPGEVWFVDQAGLVQFINREVALRLGMEPEQVLQRPISALTASLGVLAADGQPRPLAQAPLLRALQGEMLTGCEEQARDLAGEWQYRMVSASPVYDAQGRISGAVAVVQDITSLKRVEKALRTLNETLEQRVAERTALAEQRARQLRALAAELVRAEESERRRLADLLHDHLQQVLAAAMLQINFAQRQAGGQAIRSPLCQATDLLTEALDASRTLTAELSPAVLHDGGLAPALRWLGDWMSKRYGLRVKVEVLETEDKARIPEALASLLFHSARELLFNVVKHSGVTEATLQLAYPRADAVQVTVADAGRGTQTHGTEGAEHGASAKLGAGLGLPSIRERLAYVGGQFALESAPGQGTRITMTVPFLLERPEPVLPTTVAPHPRLAAPTPTAAPGEQPTPGLRLLLVDDHAIVRKGLAQLLQSQPGLEVVGEAGDGLEAVRAVREHQPDVVLMDITMPRMDGVEATRRIVAEFPRVRVIGLSMFDGAEKQAAMRAAGAVGYVAKGGSPEALLAAVRACHQLC